MTAYQANEPLHFQNALNVRELGGYQNKSGQVLKKGKLLRGGDISGLSEQEVQELIQYGIKACIDLRIGKEKIKPHPFYSNDSLIYYRIPIEGKLDSTSAPGDLLYQLYVGILEQESIAVVRALKLIANEPEGLIFHCTAGKDRTGILAMFVLSICDVCEEQIIADYATSAKNNEPAAKRQMEQLKESGLTSMSLEIFHSDPETMSRTLEYLKQNYQDPVSYLLQKGLSELDLEAIRAKMIEN